MYYRRLLGSFSLQQCTLGVSGVGGFHEIDCIVLIGASDGSWLYISYNSKVFRHEPATHWYCNEHLIFAAQ